MRRLPTLIAGLMLGALTGRAATLTWTGTAGDGRIGSAGNWSAAQAPVSGDALILSGSISLAPQLTTNLTVGSLTFDSTASAFTLGGTAGYTVSSGGILNSSAATQTIATAVTLGAAQTWNASTGDLMFGDNVTNAGFLLTLSATKNVTLNGILSGTGGLTKSGTGTLTLTGANTYSGLTTLSAGGIAIGNNSAFGTSAVTLVTTTISTSGGARTLANAITLGGTTTFTAANDVTFTGPIALTGSRSAVVSGTGAIAFNGVVSGAARKLTKSGTGTLILANANTHTGGTTLSAGTLVLGNSAAVGTGTVSLGTATLQGTGTAGTIGNLISLAGNTIFAGANDFTFTNTATLSSSRTLTINNNAVTFSGLLNQSSSTARSLTKTGAGTLTLSGTVANTYTGSTIVNNGTLVLAKTAGLNAFGGSVLTIGDSVSTANTAIVQLNASNQIPNTANVTIKLDGQLNLQSFSDAIGSLTTTGGSVLGTGRLDLGGNVTATATGTNVTSIAANLGLNATRTFLINNNSVTTDADFAVSGAIADGSAASGIVKTGAGTLLLSGANTYSGTTDVNAGIVWLDGSSAGAITSGPLGIASVNLGDVTGTATATLLQSTTSGRTIANAVNVRAGGTGLLTLGGLNASGVNTFTGAIALNRSVTLTAAAGGEVDFTGIISGAGFGITKSGAGLVKLTAANTFTGLTTVSAGTLLYGADNVLGSGAVSVLAGTLDLGTDHSDSVGAVILDTAGSILGTGVSTLTSTAPLDLRNGTVTARLAGAVALNKTTTGTVTLSGANSYTGATTISGGTLRLGAASAIPSASALSVATGTTFDLAGFGQTIGSLSGAGSVLLGSATLTAGGDNSSTTFSGVLDGAGGLTKLGTGVLTLSGVNTFTGPTSIGAGTLRLGAANVIADASPVSLNVAGGATFDLNNFGETVGSLAGAGNVTLGSATLAAGGDLSSTTFSGKISGTGNLIKLGAGLMALTGLNDLSGSITISGGTLTLSGSGTATAAASVKVDAGATVTLDNSGTNLGSRVGNGAPIFFNGGALRFVSSSGGSSETVGALELNGGNSQITLEHNGTGSTSTILTFASLGTLAPGATVNFNASGGTLGGAATGPQVYIGGLANGFIGGWATVGSDFAEYSTYGVHALTSYYAGTDGINVNDALQLPLLFGASPAGSFTLTHAGTTTDEGLSITDRALVDLGSLATNTLNLASGGLIKSTSTATAISGSGRLTAGGTAAGSLAVTADVASTLTISSPILDNAGPNGVYGDADDGVVSLAKGGGGVLVLSGANTYSGSNFINAGTLRIGAENNLGAAGNDVTFKGGTLQVTSGFTADAAKVFTVSAGLSGTLDIASGETLTFASTANALTSGNSASQFHKAGAGTLVLPGSNAAFTGNLQLDAGTLELRAANAFGGSLQINGGTLSLRADADTTFGGAAILTADTTIDVARIIGSTPVSHSLGALSIGAKTLTVTGSNASLSFGPTALTGAAIFSPATANLTLGAVSGAFGFTKSGAGLLTLASASTYSGATNVTAGTLRVGALNAISTSSAVTLSSGAVLDLNGFNAALASLAGAGNVTLGSGTLTAGAGNASTTFSGVASGTGSFTKTGSDTLTFSGANSFTGATTVSGGTLALGAAERIADTSPVTVATGATLNLNSFNETFGSLSGAGNVAAGSGALTVGGDNSSALFSGILSGTGSLTKTGSGTQSLAGPNTFSGVTTIGSGVLNVQHSSALGAATAGTVVSSGGELQLQANVALGTEALTLNGAGVAGSGALRNVADSNSLAGSVTLASAATIGADAGILALSGTISKGANLLTVTGAGTISLDGAVTGTGAAGLVKNGSGTLILSESNSFAGTTLINGGTVTLFDAGALGAIGAANETTVASGATLRLEDTTGLAIGAEILTLSGNGVGGTGAVLSALGGNSWAGAVTLAANTTVGVSADLLEFSGVISESGGSRALTKIGAGGLTLSGLNSYTGATTVSEGALTVDDTGSVASLSFSVAANAALTVVAGGKLSSSVALVADGAVDFNSSTFSLGSLSGAASGIVVLNGTTLSAGAGAFAGSIQNGASNGALTKTGAGTLLLSGANPFTGATAITGGTLTASGAGALGSTASIVVNNSGTLLLAGTGDRLNNAAGVTLAGGTFNTGGLSETVGALTLSASSTIDFGNGASVLTFGIAGSTLAGGQTLTVANWSGIPATGGGVDQLIFSQDMAGSLGQISFTGYGGAREINLGGGRFEVVPIPEPATWLAAAALLGLIGWRERRRLQRLG